MYNLRDFLMMGYRDAIGKMADYQIILSAAGWQQKGVLLDADLAEIQSMIEAQNGNGELAL